MRRLLTLAIIGLLAGCASLSEDECRTVDWGDLGYQDGASGQPVTRVGDHRKACAEYGIAPDLALYRTGYAEGVRVFCQPSNAYRYGLRGGNVRASCPADLSEAFAAAYSTGYEIFLVSDAIKRSERDIDDAKDAVEALQEDIRDKREELRKDEVSGDRRAELRSEIRRNRKRIRELEDEVLYLRDRIFDLEVERDSLVAASPY